MIDDGGPAFPVSFTGKDWDPESQKHRPALCSIEGMSLRDWFAGQALIGILLGDKSAQDHFLKAARWSYDVADAMLAEKRCREKEGNPT